jgi:uncharacterized protein YraI
MEPFMKHSALALTAIIMGLFAADAEARTVVIKNVNLRAGPDSGYPVVAKLRRNSDIRVYGCVDNYDWCDVQSGWYRGWVRSDFINTWDNGRRVTFVEAAPAPVISFNIGYWDTNYRNRPFYRDRDRWERYYHDHRGPNRHDRGDDRRDDRGRGNDDHRGGPGRH